MGRPINYLLDVTIENKVLYFDYSLNRPAEDKGQWWVIYRGAMPRYQDSGYSNFDKGDWQYIYDSNPESFTGHVEYPYDKFVDGCLYTIALYKDGDEDGSYNLADYREVIA